MPADSVNTHAETQPSVVRLADYTPPAFLIDTVDLTFTLDPTATEVVARLSVRRNPACAGRCAAAFRWRGPDPRRTDPRRGGAGA